MLLIFMGFFRRNIRLVGDSIISFSQELRALSNLFIKRGFAIWDATNEKFFLHFH